MQFFPYRYNLTTGAYPFEGDNIYRLYENIGKGEYTIPDEVDDLLRELLKGMLKIEFKERFSLQQCRGHLWTTSSHPRDFDKVPIPPLRGDKWHSMTVLPYLMDNHYKDKDDNGPVYFTERELNGK